MGLRVSGKHMDIGDAFRVRIEDRIDEALSKYFDRGANGPPIVIGERAADGARDPTGGQQEASHDPAGSAQDDVPDGAVGRHPPDESAGDQAGRS